MKGIYKMICRYFFANNILTKLRANLCDRCLSRFVTTTKTEEKTVVKKQRSKAKDYYFCIKNQSLAQIVAKYVTTDLADNSVIFESCPGRGVLTNELLKSDVQSVRVFEDNQICLKSLKKLVNKHPGRLQIIDKQILNFPKFLSLYLKDFEYEVEYWFQNIAVREWRTVPGVRKEMFFSFGRTEFFVFVSESEYRYIIARPGTNYSLYRSTTVLYNTLFNIQTLETIPYNKFEVYTNSDIDLSKIKPKSLKGNAKLIRLTPKLYLDQFNAQTLQDYYFFVNQTFMKRKNYIIPFLENWFPNCGPDLIRKGVPVFKYFGDLRPEEVLELFKYFINRSDYQNSLYKMFAMREDFDSVDDPIKDDDDIEDKIESNDKEL